MSQANEHFCDEVAAADTFARLNMEMQNFEKTNLVAEAVAG